MPHHKYRDAGGVLFDLENTPGDTGGVNPVHDHPAALRGEFSAMATALTTLAALAATAANQNAGNLTLADILAAVQGTLTIGLPIGAARADFQIDGNTKLDSIIAALSGTLTVSAPVGGATAANQVTGNSKLDSIIAAFAPASTAANQVTSNGKLDTLHTDLVTLHTDIGTPPGSATLTNVAASITSVLLVAANATRAGMYIVNDSVSATLYVKFGTAASLTSYTLLPLPPGGAYEMPRRYYTGIVHGIWSAAVGTARVTEF